MVYSHYRSIAVEKPSRLALALALALLATSLPAQGGATVTYVEGKVEYKSGSAWIGLEIGDSLKDAELSSIRLGPRSFIDFSGRSRKLSLSSPGTYDVAKLLSQPAAAANPLATRIKKLFDQTKPNQEAVGGVRAADQGGDVSGLFPDEYSLLADGKAALLAGKNTEAESSLIQAGEYAQGSDDAALLSEIAYYLGLSRASRGESAAALSALRNARWDGASAIAADYLALVISLDIQTNATAEAKATIDEALYGDAKLDKAFVEDLKKLKAGM
jgi:hypothetical protein